ncbi:hypothetical protein N2152v2_006592, partial [Parachlorella kessleri]
PVGQQDFVDEVKKGPWRPSGPVEIDELDARMYKYPRSSLEYMVPLDALASCLQGLSQRFAALDGPARSFVGLASNSTMGRLAFASTLDGCPQLEQCPLAQQEVDREYSLGATHPEYYVDGTQLSSQVAAARAFFANPPLGCGVRSKVGGATVDIKLQELGEFLGYCKNHEGLEPSVELVASTQLVARPPGDVAVTTAWYREVAGKFRAEAKDPSNKRRKASVVPLVEVWEHLDGSWGELLADFEDNGREFTTELAARCQHVGAAMLACGLHMTPLRLISIRVLHKFDHALNIPCLHTRCRNPNSCPKNHVKYTHNTQLNTNKTTIHLEHWKNEKRQGPLDITVPAGRGVEVLELMERAAAFLGPQARGLMFPQQNLRLFGVDSFEDSHFS